MQQKVIIIGAGVAGLSAAIKCKQMGHHVTLIEKRCICTHLGGGIDIHPNGVKILFSLGIEKQLRTLTQFNRRSIQISSAEGKCLNKVPLDLFEREPNYPLMSFLRQDLLKVLFEQSTIDEIYEHTECAQVSSDREGVEVAIGGSLLRGDILIGADGINSVVRKSFFPKTETRYLGHISLGGSISVNYFTNNYIHGLQRTCVVFPCSRRSCHTVMFMPKPQGWLRKNAPEFVQQKDLFYGWSNEVDDILDHLDEKNGFAVESFEVPPLPYHAKGRIFLIGDAAHAMSPLGALATSLALEDVQCLADSLRVHDSFDQAVRRFNQITVPRAKEYHSFSQKTLLPAVVSHGVHDYTARISRIEQASPYEVFTSLIELTQGQMNEGEYGKEQITRSKKNKEATCKL